MGSLLQRVILSRFSKYKELYADMSCFEPKVFVEMTARALPENVLQQICKFIPTNDDDCAVLKLRGQLLDFAKKWSRLKMTFSVDVC